MDSIVSLIVHDERTRVALAGVAAAGGFSVQGFRDVASFLEPANADSLGCVVVDLEPPCTLLQLQAVADRLPAIVLSSPGNVALAVQAMKDGAEDVLQKPVDPDVFLAALRGAVEKSRSRFERAMRARQLRDRYDTLSPREIEVVDAVLSGGANKDVATRLGISARTVEAHRSNVMSKLGTRTLADLVRIWLDIEATAAR